jgi:carboxyl-terminal processing protease
MWRLLYLTFTVLCAASQTLSQLPLSRINDAIDPFEIGNSRSFFASRGGKPISDPSPMGGRESRKIIGDLAEAIEVIRSNHVAGREIDLNAITKSAISGALQSLDPHSSYFDAPEYGDFLNEEQSEYSGIGASITGFARGEQYDTYVTSVLPGSPAALARLSFGDRIIRVNGESVSGRDTNTVSEAVRGAAGTMLNLTVERAATGHIETLFIRRRLVQQPSIRDTYLLPGGIGYIAMTEGFNYTTANELAASLRQLHKDGAKGLILDIRENPGGILEQAVRVAEKFLPAGSLILTQRGRSKLDNRVWTSTNRSPEAMPLVLLVNENSASASEILAGALQDHDRALIIGQRTFGKGLVQSLFDGPQGTGLTLTTARYYTPSGRSIQRDYSDGRLYDYYNHRVDEATMKRTEARTSANREVFGGDGIEPDIQIASHQMGKIERDLDDAMFFFTRDLLNGRLNSGFSLKMNIVKTGMSETADASLNEQLLNEFQNYAKREPGSAFTDADLTSERLFIGQRLSYYITLARKGDILANRLATTNDVPVLKAMSELPRARELAIASLNKH